MLAAVDEAMQRGDYRAVQCLAKISGFLELHGLSSEEERCTNSCEDDENNPRQHATQKYSTPVDCFHRFSLFILCRTGQSAVTIVQLSGMLCEVTKMLILLCVAGSPHRSRSSYPHSEPRASQSCIYR